MSIYVPPRPQIAKAMLGPGAAAMITQPQLQSHYGPLAQQKRMHEAYTISHADPWIRAAEKTISGRFGTVEWHLEDDADAEIDDQYVNPVAQAAWSLMEKPQAALTTKERPLTRTALWTMTCRDMGVCGNAFWYLDQLEPFAKTPAAIIYIAPWRMSAATDPQGNLTGWVLDYNERTGTGTPLDTLEVLQFVLERSAESHFGIGLVETAMAKSTLNRATTSLATQTLSSGGRLAGILSPKTDFIPDEKFQQLVRDFRTIAETPDAAKRTNILQNPIDFIKTGSTFSELELVALMNNVRDDILALWGVPLSQIGGNTATGLNGGEARHTDEASMWQNAIHPRLESFRETLQFGLLDRYKILGLALDLEIDEPTFNDDGPRFELLQRSAGLPMRNVERRALIGLDPFGDPALDNAIYLPINIAQVAIAPDELGNDVSSTRLVGGPQEVTPDIPVKAALTGSALRDSLLALRARVERSQTPNLKAALATFLSNQRHEIATRLRANAHHTRGVARDTAVWFPQARFDRELTGVLGRPLTAMAQTVSDHIASVLPTKAGPVDAVERALHRGAARVTGINQRTRDDIAAAVSAGIDQGLTVLEVADMIEGLSTDTLALGALFDEYRAEMIARTELMDAYNGAAIASYRDGGLSFVQAIDGDQDDACAQRNGGTYSLDDADAIVDHPNGTLDWIPLLGSEVVL